MNPGAKPTPEATPQLPAKKYFRIGEVCRLTQLKPHVLRYWETEFKFLKPLKAKSRQRLYRKKDVEIILRIKHLLYDKKYTIAGAKVQLEKELKSKNGPLPARQLSLEFEPADRRELLDAIIAELQTIRALLDKEPEGK